LRSGVEEQNTKQLETGKWRDDSTKSSCDLLKEGTAHAAPRCRVGAASLDLAAWRTQLTSSRDGQTSSLTMVAAEEQEKVSSAKPDAGRTQVL